MKRLISSIWAAPLYLWLVQSAFGAGIVAETQSGKVILFEWNTHGTEIPPVFDSATLKIVDKAGETLYEEVFKKEHLIEYDEENREGSKYKVRLLIQRAKATFNLMFNGTNHNTVTVDGEKEIDVLVRILKQRGRVIEAGSRLSVDTPIGLFIFKDVICGIYGDI